MRRILAATVGVMLAAGPVSAESDISPAMKQVVEAAYLATLVPELCPEYEIDMETFAAIMQRLHITQQEMGLSGKYASYGTSIQLQFRAYADKDRAKACSEAGNLLTGEAVHLLRRKG